MPSKATGPNTSLAQRRIGPRQPHGDGAPRGQREEGSELFLGASGE